jgi:hypothetical protein
MWARLTRRVEVLSGDNVARLRRGFVAWFWRAAAGMTIALASYPAVGDAFPANERPTIIELIHRLTALAPLDKDKVERAVGVKFGPPSTPFNNFHEDFHTVHNVALKDSTLDLVDYRELSFSDGSAKFGLLRLVLSGICISSREIRDAYRPTIFDTDPSSENAEMYMGRMYPWGMLSFGFLQFGSDCVHSVIFKARGG